MIRCSYTFAMEITPTAPLTHGAGNARNEQLLHVRQYTLEVEGRWDRVAVPAVSGAAWKGALREHAVRDAFERLGVQPGEVSRDALRLLSKGGKNDRGSATVALEEARRLRDLFPLLSVFGSLDGGLPLKGRVQVSDVLPYCDALVAAGLVPRRVQPVTVEVEGHQQEEGPAVEVYPDTPPVPLHLARTSVTNYRHDMLQGSMAHMLSGETVRQIEDAREAVRSRKDESGSAPARQRREANESMPHSAQAIAPGTPLVGVVRLQDATEVELGCLVTAIMRWITSGAYLGGGAAKGHGACRVRVAGALRHAMPPGSLPTAPATALDLPRDGSPSAAAMAYGRHVLERRDACLTFLRSSTRE